MKNRNNKLYRNILKKILLLISFLTAVLALIKVVVELCEDPPIINSDFTLVLKIVDENGLLVQDFKDRIEVSTNMHLFTQTKINNGFVVFENISTDHMNKKIEISIQSEDWEINQTQSFFSLSNDSLNLILKKKVKSMPPLLVPKIPLFRVIGRIRNINDYSDYECKINLVNNHFNINDTLIVNNLGYFEKEFQNIDRIELKFSLYFIKDEEAEVNDTRSRTFSNGKTSEFRF